MECRMLLSAASRMQSSSTRTMAEVQYANSLMKMTHSWKGIWKTENNGGCEMEQQETLLLISSKVIRRYREEKRCSSSGKTLCSGLACATNTSSFQGPLTPATSPASATAAQLCAVCLESHLFSAAIIEYG